ncbi:hypothetical protein HDV00_003901 [Rhizophlyctis rosea]|nr:hypothetical protein HDV00_003901 [Rhizophlyctis rosea]
MESSGPAYYSDTAKRRFDIYGRQDPDITRHLYDVAAEVNEVIGPPEEDDDAELSRGRSDALHGEVLQRCIDAAKDDRADEIENVFIDQAPKVPSAEASLQPLSTRPNSRHHRPSRPPFIATFAWGHPLEPSFPTSVMSPPIKPAHASRPPPYQVSEYTAKINIELEQAKLKLSPDAILAPQAKSAATNGGKRPSKKAKAQRHVFQPINLHVPPKAAQYFRPAVMKYIDNPALKPPIPGGTVKLLRDAPHRHKTIIETIKFINPEYGTPRDPFAPRPKRIPIRPHTAPEETVRARTKREGSMSAPPHRRISGSTSTIAAAAPTGTGVTAYRRTSMSVGDTVRDSDAGLWAKYEAKWAKSTPALHEEKMQIRRKSIVEWSSTLPGRRRGSVGSLINVGGAGGGGGGGMGMSGLRRGSMGSVLNVGRDMERRERGGIEESIVEVENGDGEGGGRVWGGAPLKKAYRSTVRISSATVIPEDRPASTRGRSLWSMDEKPGRGSTDKLSRSSDKLSMSRGPSKMFPAASFVSDVTRSGGRPKSSVPPSTEEGLIDKVVKTVIDKRKEAARVQKLGQSRNEFRVIPKAASLGDRQEADIRALACSVWAVRE